MVRPDTKGYYVLGYFMYWDTMYWDGLPLGRFENERFGDLWLFACVTGVEATCLRLLTRYMGWEERYFRALCTEVADEMKRMANDPDRAKGFVVKLRVLVGRKPDGVQTPTMPTTPTTPTTPMGQQAGVGEANEE
jgi:hypothetical protein